MEKELSSKGNSVIDSLEEQIRLLQEKLNQEKEKQRTREENVSEITAKPNTSVNQKVNNSNLATYKKTRGSNDKGREYEYLMCAYFGLKLSTDKKVTYFEMTTNNKKYGIFDDISLKITFTDESVKTYLLQLKHKECEKALTTTNFAKSNDFGLDKYIESYETLDEPNAICVLFTNCSCNLEDNVDFQVDRKLKKENNNSEEKQTFLQAKVSKEEISPVLNTILVSKKNIDVKAFRFMVADDDKKIDKFSENFYFLPDQVNVYEVKALISQFFQYEPRVEELFVAYMKEWRDGNFVLNRTDLVAKLTELSFSPWIQAMSSEYFCQNKFVTLLRKAVMDFEITFFANVTRDIRNVFYPDVDLEKELISKAEVKYGISAKKQKHIILWYLYEVPLFVKVDKTNLKNVRAVLKFLTAIGNRRRIVFYGDVKIEDLELQDTTFTSLHNLSNTAYFNDIISSLKVCIQEKDTTSIADLAREDPEIIRSVTTKELCKAAKESCISVKLDDDQNTFSDFYIERTIVQKGITLNNIDAVINSVTVLCGPAGIGKTFLFKVLCSKSKPNCWSIFVNLLDKSSFLETNPNVDCVLCDFLNLEETQHKTFLGSIKNIFLKTKEVHVFLDGLDEIELRCRQVIYTFTKEVIGRGFKVWINCRDELKNEILENLTCDFRIIEIEELNKKEQVNYLQNGLKNVYSSEEIANIIDVLFESLRATRSEELLGNPSHLNAIVKMFCGEKGRQVYNDIKQDGLLVLTKLVRQLIAEARSRFCEKYKIRHEHIWRTISDSYENQFKLFALVSCLGEAVITKLNLDIEDLMRQDKLGLIRNIDTDNRAVFIHRKYAEYFASVWLSTKFERVRNIKSEIFSKSCQNLKQMLDIVLADDCKLHLAVIYAKIEQVGKHVDKIGHKDRGDRTPVHLLFSYGVSERESVTEIEKTLRLFVKEEKCIYQTDKLFNFDCVEYLKRCNCLTFRQYVAQNYNICL